MPGERESKEAVLLLGSGSNVVDNERDAFAGFFIAHNHDVRSASHRAGNDIAGEIIFWVFAENNGITASFEVGLKVGNATVVNVAIRPLEPPYLWVL